MRSVILTLGVAAGLLGFAGTSSAHDPFYGGRPGYGYGRPGYGYGGGYYRPVQPGYGYGGFYPPGRYYTQPYPRYGYGYPGYGYGGGYGYPGYGYGGGYGGYRPGFSFGLTIVR